MGTLPKMLSSCLFLALALPAMSQECPDLQPSTCMEGDIICDMGMNGACWNGDYCMQKDLFVLLLVTTLHHQHVLILQMLCVTMGWMQMVVGWEISACLLVTPVPWPVLLFHHLTAPALSYCVTWA